jgi:glutathione peroxidase-family protein
MSAKLKNVVAALFLILAAADAVTMPWSSTSTKAAETKVTSASAEVGKPAPAFTLPDSNGKKTSLSDFKGKVVVLEWVNFDCPFVQKHYGSHNMQRLQEKYVGKGVIWLSINSSAAGRQGNYPGAKVNSLIKEHKAHQTAYLIDENGAVGHLYNAKTTPHMFVVDKSGNLVYAGAIDDKNSPDEADIKTAKNYVDAALEEVLAGKPVTTASTKSYGCSVKY